MGTIRPTGGQSPLVGSEILTVYIRRKLPVKALNHPHHD